MYRTPLCLALTCALAVCLSSDSRAATPSKTTTITLEVLTCESCAKKVAAKLSEVPDVGGVKTDVKTKRAFVIPKRDTTLSPLRLWEAIEKAGKKPVKLEGPSGTFTSKPKR